MYEIVKAIWPSLDVHTSSNTQSYPTRGASSSTCEQIVRNYQLPQLIMYADYNVPFATVAKDLESYIADTGTVFFDYTRVDTVIWGNVRAHLSTVLLKKVAASTALTEHWVISGNAYSVEYMIDTYHLEIGATTCDPCLRGYFIPFRKVSLADLVRNTPGV